MTLKDLKIKSCYDSTFDNLIEDFYIPVLKNTFMYKRIAGFFSSSSLAVAACGMYEIYKNNGKIKILMSPKLTKEDIEIMKKYKSNPRYFLEEKLINELKITEDIFEKECQFMLGYLLSEKILEIKIVILKDDSNNFLTEKEISKNSIFHQKIGIFEDFSGYGLSFSGSINETFNGWVNNIEEFKVFKSWDKGQNAYYESDLEKFNKYWNNDIDSSKIQIIDLPEAVNRYLIENKNLDSKFSLEKYISKVKNKKNKLNLFFYQEEAIEKWKKNDFKLLFEMATGTGKTRTALGCLKYILEKKEKIITIISTPQNTLSIQWKKDIEDLEIVIDKIVIADSTNKKWRSDLEEGILDLGLDLIDNLVIFTTHITSSKDDFIYNLEKFKGKILFIGDEVHALGAEKLKNALDERYFYRIGLSATPSRWFDDIGSKYIENYFGNNSYIFDIERALLTTNPLTQRSYLVNYYYNLIFVNLTKDEQIEYDILTKKIIKYGFSDESKYSENRNRLLIKRSKIIKNAYEKYAKFYKLMKELKDEYNIIIFVSDQQINEVMLILNALGIRFTKITQDTKTKKVQILDNRSLREEIIKDFKERKYQALIAIKCLDEGIDIPTADTAILLSNTTNPREYIQRIGRVIRDYPNKANARIYDFIVSAENRTEKDLILEKEKKRVIEISKHSLNYNENIIKINNI